MAIVATVNGVTRGLKDLNISASQNEIDRATCILLSPTGSDIPAIDHELIVTEDGTRIFGGSIKTPTRTGFGDALPPYVSTNVSAMDFNELASRQTVDITIPPGTLKQALQALLPYLPGVTLDAGQLDGPSLPEIVCIDSYVVEVFDELSTRTGWIRDINYSKVLKFIEIGTVAAPWNISDSDLYEVNPLLRKTIGDMTVSETRIDYANRIVVKFMEAARKAYAFLTASANFSNGETITLGSQVYTFQTVLTDSPGNVLIGGSTQASLENFIAAVLHAGGAGSIYAASTTANSQAVAVLLSASGLKAIALSEGAAGNSISALETAANANWFGEGNSPLTTLHLGSDASLTNKAVANDLTEQGLVGVYVRVVEAPTVFDYDSALLLAQSILAAAIVTERTVNYYTYRPGLFPGMTQNIQRASRGLNADCLITSVITAQQDGILLFRSITAIVGDIFKGDRFRKQYQKWSGKIEGTATVFPGAGGGGGGGGGAGGGAVYLLGGTPEVWVQSPTPTWVAASGGTDGQGGIEYRIDAVVRGSTNATVYVRLRAASGTVQARLWDVTAGTQVGISTTVSSTTFQLRSFPVTLFNGSHIYRLELLPSLANVDVNGVGYLE